MTIQYEPPEIYRGVSIQNFQTRERIERRVKPEIDRVLDMSAVDELFRYCGDVSRPPEARMLAAAMLEAIYDQAAIEKRTRPDVSLEQVRARTAGLEEGCAWRSPWSYGCMGDRKGVDGSEPEMRPEILTDEQLRNRREVPLKRSRS